MPLQVRNSPKQNCSEQLSSDKGVGRCSESCNDDVKNSLLYICWETKFIPNPVSRGYILIKASRWWVNIVRLFVAYSPVKFDGFIVPNKSRAMMLGDQSLRARTVERIKIFFKSFFQICSKSLFHCNQEGDVLWFFIWASDLVAVILCSAVLFCAYLR